jgi:hypothetical protein
MSTMRVFVCKECAGERCVKKWWHSNNPTLCSWDINRICNWTEIEPRLNNDELRHTVDELQEANNEIARLRSMLEKDVRDYASIRRTNVEMANELEALRSLDQSKKMTATYALDTFTGKCTGCEMGMSYKDIGNIRIHITTEGKWVACRNNKKNELAFWQHEVEESKGRERIWEKMYNELFDELKKIRERKMKWIRRFDEKCSEKQREIESLKAEIKVLREIRILELSSTDEWKRFADERPPRFISTIHESTGGLKADGLWLWNPSENRVAAFNLNDCEILAIERGESRCGWTHWQWKYLNKPEPPVIDKLKAKECPQCGITPNWQASDKFDGKTITRVWCASCGMSTGEIIGKVAEVIQCWNYIVSLYKGNGTIKCK